MDLRHFFKPLSSKPPAVLKTEPEPGLDPVDIGAAKVQERLVSALSEIGVSLDTSSVVNPSLDRVCTPPPAQKNRDIALYKSLLGGLYDGVLVLDPTGVVIASNHRAEQFLGYSEPELWGMSCEELIIGINARVLHKLHTHAEEGRFTVVNGTCKRKDTTTFPAEIAISRIRFFNDGDLIFSIRSIERREKVREQRGLEEEAIRSSGAGIVVCSIEGAIEYVNAAFMKLLNLASEQDIIKHMIGDFCTSYEQVNTMMHTPSTQGNWQGTLELVTPKGGKREVMCIAALSQAHRGAAPRIVLTVIPLPKAVR